MNVKMNIRFWSMVAILGFTAVASALADRRGTQTLVAPLESVPTSIAGWAYDREAPLDAHTIERLNASGYVSRDYKKDGRQLGLFLAYYTRQSTTGYMHSPKICLPGSGWEIKEPGTVRVATPMGEREINRYIISNGGQQALIFYWYQSSDRIVADEFLTKLYMIHDGLIYGRGAGSIVRLQVPTDAASEQDGLKFATQIMSDLRHVYGS